MAARSWTGGDDSAIKDGLHGIEGGFRHERIKIAAARHTEIRARNLSDVKAIPEQITEALRSELQSFARAQSQTGDEFEDFAWCDDPWPLLRTPAA